MKIGFTCSTFDLFHAGHIMMLKEAKTQCDHLIVGLQTDPTIDRPGIKNKPVQSVFERYEQLKACKYVDEILVYETEEDLVNILLSYPINVRILGQEYENEDFTGRYECKKIVTLNSISTNANIIFQPANFDKESLLPKLIKD